MKTFLLVLSLFTFGTTVDRQVVYTASTPAGSEVRNFLGINQADSIDFIRWQLKIIDDKEFDLSCSYGISKPNTNGFIHENKLVVKGTVILQNGLLTLNSNGRSLSMQVLNQNILHPLNRDGSLMAGNGGWSYTLNSTTRLPAQDIYLKQNAVSFKDSIVFEGRTPCRGIDEMMIGQVKPDCYKKKWLVYLYKNQPTATTGTYKIGSTVGSYAGKWKLKETATGKTIYSLDLNNGRSLGLLHADKNVVYLVDTKGELMVGDHDFSYSLNRKFK